MVFIVFDCLRSTQEIELSFIFLYVISLSKMLYVYILHWQHGCYTYIIQNVKIFFRAFENTLLFNNLAANVFFLKTPIY